jgi:hypothetical protein
VAQITLRAAADEGRLLARQLYHQSARTIGVGGSGIPGHPGSAGGAAPQPTADALRPDAGLRALVEGMVGYSRVVVYAAVVDPAGRAVVHSDPALEGTTPGPRPALEDVLAWGAPRMAVALLQAPQIYETRLPIRIGERPFGSVRVGVSTSLVRQELREALLRSVALGAGALLVAVGVGLGAGRLLLQSLRRIARGSSAWRAASPAPASSSGGATPWVSWPSVSTGWASGSRPGGPPGPTRVEAATAPRAPSSRRWAPTPRSWPPSAASPRTWPTR